MRFSHFSALSHKLQQLALPDDLFADVPVKFLRQYQRRTGIEAISHLKRHPAPLRYTLLAAFCWLRKAQITSTARLK